MELNRHFVLPRFLWTAQGKDGLKWVGLNTFEFLSQILKFSLKYETSKFCLQNQKPLYYITHTQTNYNKILFFRRKNPKVLFSFRYTQQGPRNNFYLVGGGANNLKSENLRFFKFLLYKSPILGGPAPSLPSPPVPRPLHMG